MTEGMLADMWRGGGGEVWWYSRRWWRRRWRLARSRVVQVLFYEIVCTSQALSLCHYQAKNHQWQGPFIVCEKETRGATSGVVEDTSTRTREISLTCACAVRGWLKLRRVHYNLGDVSIHSDIFFSSNTSLQDKSVDGLCSPMK